MSTQPNPTLSEILEIMFDAWCLHENSYVVTDPLKEYGEYEIKKAEAFIKVTKEKFGDENINAPVGYLIYLFDHWSNDIQSIAAHRGIGIRRNPKSHRLERYTVPPAPSLEHRWADGEWIAPSKEDWMKDSKKEE